jgi:hypothetical protein
MGLEYVDMIVIFGKCGSNVREAVIVYREHFPVRENHSDHKMI